VIEIVLHALPIDGPPVVTTFDSIDKVAVQDAMGPIMARLVSLMERVTRVQPVAITVCIQWAGEGDGEPEKKEEKKPAGPSKPVPKWMS
jgi:hypothetical protein